MELLSGAALRAVVVGYMTVFGLLVGSFANVPIHRWPNNKSVRAPGRSVCLHCDEQLRWHDNIPVLSWLWLRAKSRCCNQPIPWRYPLVELAVAALFGIVAHVWFGTFIMWPLLVFMWGLVVASVIDLQHRIIPNRLTYPLPLVLAALLGVDATIAGDLDPFARGILAGVLMPAGLLFLNELYVRLRGKVAIGMGDVKLTASLALVVAYLDPVGLVVMFYGTAISGALIAGGLLAARKTTLASRIPFGPYLAFGAAVPVLAPTTVEQARAWLMLT